MNLNSFESKMLKDAVIEYWHNNIKNSKNERVKNQYRCMMEDVKTITTSNSRHTITINH
jgi:hypothetical protein